MIENTLIYFDLYEDFEQLKDQIQDSSIAFVKEGRIIYTHGVEFSTRDLEAYVDEVRLNAADLIDRLEKDLEKEASDLHNESIKLHDELVNKARKDIEDAIGAMQRYSDLLNDMLEKGILEKYDQEIEEINGTITAHASYFSTITDALTSGATELQQKLDAVNATITTLGNHVGLHDDTLTSYLQQINLIKGTFDQYLKKTDVLNAIVTELGRQMNANDGILRDYATRTELANALRDYDVTKKVETVLDAKTPSWSTLVSETQKNGSDITDLSSKITVNTSSISALTSKVNSQGTDLAALKLRVDGIDDEGNQQAEFQLTAEMVNNVLNSTHAATIFGYANQNGSGITLKADKILALGDFIAQYVVANRVNAGYLEVGTGSNKIVIDDSGIKHTATKPAFLLLTDGSGFLGYTDSTKSNKAVWWGTDGILHMNSIYIGGGGSSSGSDYDDSAIKNRLDDLESWLTIINSWKSQLNVPSAYAYLDNAGIIFDNSASANQVVAVTSVAATPESGSTTIPAGVSHTITSGSRAGQHGYYLKNDGSGEVAFGYLKWSSNGYLEINGDIIQVGGKNVLTEGNFEDKIKNSTVLTNWVNDKVAGLSDEEKQRLMDDIVENFDLSEYATVASLSGYVQKTGLTSQVVDSDGNTLASIVNMAKRVNAWDNTNGFLYSTFVQKSEIDDIVSDIDVSSAVTTAALREKLDGIYRTEAQVSSQIESNSKVQAVSKLQTWVSGIQNSWESGFDLSAASNNFKAGIVGIVKDNKSSLQLSASDVNITANDLNLNANNIKIGGSGTDSNLTIAAKIDAVDAKFNNVTVNELNASDSTNNTTMLVNANNLKFTQNNNINIQLNADGSGSLANGNISWDASGHITIKNADIDGNTTYVEPAQYDLGFDMYVSVTSTTIDFDSDVLYANYTLYIYGSTYNPSTKNSGVGFDYTTTGKFAVPMPDENHLRNAMVYAYTATPILDVPSGVYVYLYKGDDSDYTKASAILRQVVGYVQAVATVDQGTYSIEKSYGGTTMRHSTMIHGEYDVEHSGIVKNGTTSYTSYQDALVQYCVEKDPQERSSDFWRETIGSNFRETTDDRFGVFLANCGGKNPAKIYDTPSYT